MKTTAIRLLLLVVTPLLAHVWAWNDLHVIDNTAMLMGASYGGGSSGQGFVCEVYFQ